VGLGLWLGSPRVVQEFLSTLDGIVLAVWQFPV
jgi:hypothetical protein